MKENNVVEFAGREAFADSLTELLRTGARQLIEQAVVALAARNARLIWTFMMKREDYRAIDA